MFKSKNISFSKTIARKMAFNFERICASCKMQLPEEANICVGNARLLSPVASSENINELGILILRALEMSMDIFVVVICVRVNEEIRRVFISTCEETYRKTISIDGLISVIEPLLFNAGESAEEMEMKKLNYNRSICETIYAGLALNFD